MEFIKNVKLAKYTTFKIGGQAKYFCVVKDKDDLVKAVSFAKKEKLPFFVLGGGSNLLVSDKGFNGLVIKIQNTKYKIQDTMVSAGAGLSLAKLLTVTANAGLSGLEWSAGIPGATIGGAIRGNAGAFETGMKDIVKKVKTLGAKNQKIRIFNNKDCQFDYRDSIFKKNHNLIIFSAELELKKSDKKIVQEKVREILKYRIAKHPKFPSAGSIFKNFTPYRNKISGTGPKNMKTKDLIEKAGLKGKKIGGAEISEQHANFIVNTGGAKAKDVLALINLAKKEVKNKLGIKIEEEIYYLS